MPEQSDRLRTRPAGISLRLIPVIIRIRRMIRYHHGIFLQRFQRHLYGFFELRVVARGNRGWIILHFDVRSDAVIFHFPFAVQAVNRGSGRGHATAIEQRRITAYSHQTAPGTGADQWADFVLVEHPWERVAAGTGHFVDDHGFWPINLRQGRAPLFAFARSGATSQRTFQQIDDVIGDGAAVVVTLVDNGGLLVRLREIKTVGAEKSAVGGIRHVDIRNLSTAKLDDLAAVVFFPRAVAEVRFVLDRNYGDIARVFSIRIRADLDTDLLTGGVFEITVNIAGRAHFRAVDFQQVVADFDVDTWLRERRAQFGIPVFAVKNFGKAVAAVFDFIIGPQQPAFNLGRFGNVAAEDEHVSDGHFAKHLGEKVIQIGAASGALEIWRVLLFS